MSLQPHELDLIRREQDEQNLEIQFEAFKPDAVFRVKECFKNNGDLVDLINDLDMEYDSYESLSNSQINEIVLEAIKGVA